MRMRMIDSRVNKRWSLATNFCVAALTFAAGVTAAWVRAPVITPSPTPQHIEVNYETAEIGTLRRAILDAKARGENTVELFVIGCGWDIGRLNQALSRDTVVLADLIDKKTYADTYGLHTWYKFKTKETFVDHPKTRLTYSPFPTAPSELLPIAEDEFLIVESNGRMEIDGITVTQHSNGVWYREGQTYLLFIWKDPSKGTAVRAGTDPLGVFLVDNDGNLSSYVDKDYPLKTDLAKRFNNSTNNLRQVLKKAGSQ